MESGLTAGIWKNPANPCESLLILIVVAGLITLRTLRGSSVCEVHTKVSWFDRAVSFGDELCFLTFLASSVCQPLLWLRLANGGHIGEAMLFTIMQCCIAISILSLGQDSGILTSVPSVAIAAAGADVVAVGCSERMPAEPHPTLVLSRSRCLALVEIWRIFLVISKTKYLYF